MNNIQINRKAIVKVANALGDLNERVVYVGGAVISLYIDDPAAEDVRPTKDIDLTFEIASLSALEQLRENLIERGFYQSQEDDVICRFRYDDLKVDVLATTPVGWAPANTWIGAGFNSAILIEIEEFAIKILQFPYFLASKFEAFFDRGGKDPRTSHDFEDIVYLLNYNTTPAKLILTAGEEVHAYLKNAFHEILESDPLQEAIWGNLYFEDRTKRFERIINQFKIVVENE